MSKPLRIVLPEISCRKIVVPFDMVADLFPIVANDENQLGEVRDFDEWFEEVVEDGTPRNMYERLRSRKGVGSQSRAAAGGRDNGFHWNCFLR